MKRNRQAREHRRTSKRERMLTEMRRRVTDEIMNDLCYRGKALERMFSDMMSRAVRITPIPIPTIDLRSVRMEVVHGHHFDANRGGWERILREYREDAAQKLARRIIDDGLVKETVVQIPERHVSHVTWEAVIGKEDGVRAPT